MAVYSRADGLDGGSGAVLGGGTTGNFPIYSATGTWKGRRKVTASQEVANKGSKPRFDVTKLVGDGQAIYDKVECASRLLKNPLAAPCGVGNGLKMLMYTPVHCAFSPISALSGIHQKLFQQPARGYARIISIINTWWCFLIVPASITEWQISLACCYPSGLCGEARYL
jgi:hypothetical protein